MHVFKNCIFFKAFRCISETFFCKIEKRTEKIFFSLAVWWYECHENRVQISSRARCSLSPCVTCLEGWVFCHDVSCWLTIKHYFPTFTFIVPNSFRTRTHYITAFLSSPAEMFITRLPSRTSSFHPSKHFLRHPNRFRSLVVIGRVNF